VSGGRDVHGCRNLVLVLGDQLTESGAAFDGFDRRRDIVWMAEADEESIHVPSHRARIALFLSAMRHFRDRLRGRGLAVHYTALDDEAQTLSGALEAAVHRLGPERLVVAEPGEWRVLEALRRTADRLDRPLEVRPDTRFLCSAEQFAAHAVGRKQLRMEYFYREMRRRTGMLMEGKKPAGGRWNFDAENRGAFGREGPGPLPAPVSFEPDKVTRGVIQDVRRRFPDNPGGFDRFDWPVNGEQARAALEDFITNRLPFFGRYQDAIWLGEPWLYHSRLSAAMNLGLLDPREAIAAAERAWGEGRAPIASAEGFIRQVLGWREYVRGIYWRFMPEYLERNALGAEAPLPACYWTGETEMACLADALKQTLAYGYAHHIQRLMVTGLFALLLGVAPREVHRWYLAIYVDAVEWVELPNTLGMSQYADGGVMASKPYVATGAYIRRMSNACRGCRFDPGDAAGPDACPYTTLYWDFLMRHEKRLAGNPRMGLQLRNLGRKDTAEGKAIRRRAARVRSTLTA